MAAKSNANQGKAAKAAGKKPAAAKAKAGADPKAKAVAKKAPAAKTAAAKPAKAPAKKAAAAKAPAAADRGNKPLSRGGVIAALAESTDLKRPQVRAFFDALLSLASEELKKDGVHTFAIPGLVKLTARYQEAQPEREGIDRFTGEKRTFKAKDAEWKVKGRPLKLLRDLAAK